MIDSVEIEAMKLAKSARIQRQIDELYLEIDRLDSRKNRLENWIAELEDVLDSRRAKEENDYYIRSKFPGSLNRRWP